MGNEFQMWFTHFWSNLAAVWSITESCTVSPLDEAIAEQAKADNSWKLLRREKRARLLLLDPESPDPRAILKIYRTPRHLAWRTFGMVSRANREFTLLMKAHRQGLPVVCPLSWREERVKGLLAFSAISLELEQGSNAEDIFKSTETTLERRLQIAGNIGVLLRSLHKAGMFWGTAYPSNVLVKHCNDQNLLVLDTPYAQWHNRDLTGNELALTDLRSIVRAKRALKGFSHHEKTQLLTGYCGTELDMLSELETLVMPHSTRRSKFVRFRQRSAYVLLNRPSSPGRAGTYLPAEAIYSPDEA